MAKIHCFSVVNVGFAYDVMNHGLVLYSFSTKCEANARAFELAREFGGSVCLLR